MMSDQLRFTFGDPETYPETVKPMAKQLNEMHRMYGAKREYQTCGLCAHFERHSQANTWFKCGLTVQTHGPATDWQYGWPACGRWEAKT